MWFYSRKGFIEFLCTRAWLPTSTLWYFQPRDEHFDSGGWYIEHNKHGQRGDRINSFYQKYKPREGFHSARSQPSSDSVETEVSDAETEDMSESTASISPSGPTPSSSSPKEEKSTRGKSLSSSSSSSEASQPHQLYSPELMIKNATQQTHDNTNHARNNTTGTSTIEYDLLHIDQENKKNAMEELPCLHHSVCIFTCAFTTLQKLKTNHLYP